MKANLRQPLVLIASLAFTMVAAAQEREAPVKVNVDGLPSHVRVRILEKAQHGQTAVIRYLQRTQGVHQLRAESVIREEIPAVVVFPGGGEAATHGHAGDLASR